MRLRHVLVAVAAGLALADAAIVTLALPELLRELHTTVEGVAAVLGVYTVVLAVALLPAERLGRRIGPSRLGAGGLLVFAAACLGCGLVSDLAPLLVGRAVQAVGGAAALIAAFALLEPYGAAGAAGRRLWLWAAVLSSACGPALGGALTQALSWRAIFLVQVPVAVVAAWACLAERRAAGVAGATHPGEPTPGAAPPHGDPREARPPRQAPWGAAAAPHDRAGASGARGSSVAAGADVQATDATGIAVATRFAVGPSIALAFVSAALTAVLFLLVLLLVAGWDVPPLRAAVAVTVIPAGALVGSRLRGEARTRAAAGCALVAAGVLALAFLPGDNLWWTVPPQAAAGLGMGLALPALGGELLPERTTHDAAKLLTLRHAGIALALALLAPVVSADLDATTQRARERGIAVVLDAKVGLTDKIRLAPELLKVVDAEQPRTGLRTALAANRASISPGDRPGYDALGRAIDDTLVTAVGEAFRAAFLVTGALALLATVALLPVRRTRYLAIAAGVTVALPLGWLALHATVAPKPVAIRDPCQNRPLPGAGLVQDIALQTLDATACRLGSGREELLLALVDADDRRRFEARHGVDPRDALGPLGQLLR